MAGGGQFISLECIKNRLPIGGPGSGGDSIPARGLGLAENDGFHMALTLDNLTRYLTSF